MNGQIKLKPGKSYRLVLPISSSQKKVHVDFVLDNPTRPEWYCKLVVCRYWLSHKRRWSYHVFPYYVLAIYNEWEYK